jgi:hypothetical protein
MGLLKEKMSNFEARMQRKKENNIIEENLSDEFEIPKELTSTKYQYSYVDLEIVISNPDEYIIPECQPACKAFWQKNIETFMVSNYDDDHLYVLLFDLSEENIDIFKSLMEKDSRYFFDYFKETYGIGTKDLNEKSTEELLSLTNVFKIQDTLRYQSPESFLEDYKRRDGEFFVDPYGVEIVRKINPSLENATLEEALEKTGKKDLYIPEENRIYESNMFLEWHKRYVLSTQSGL